MTLKDFLKDYRLTHALSQRQLAKNCGLSNGYISMLERGVNPSTGQPVVPNLQAIQKLAVGMGLTLVELCARVEDLPIDLASAGEQPAKKGRSPAGPLPLSAEAETVARDYDGLDRHGKTVVRVVLSEEKRRAEEELRRQRERRERFDALSALDGEPVEPRVIPLYLTPAAAGYLSPAFGEDFEYLEVDGGVPYQADFAVKIDGDSMEPYLMDGSVAYVNRDPLAEGDIGIFYVDGDIVCKQYHRDREGGVHLLSLNRERADADRHIPVDSGVALTCYGRVILPHRPAVALP